MAADAAPHRGRGRAGFGFRCHQTEMGRGGGSLWGRLHCGCLEPPDTPGSPRADGALWCPGGRPGMTRGQRGDAVLVEASAARRGPRGSRAGCPHPRRCHSNTARICSARTSLPGRLRSRARCERGPRVLRVAVMPGSRSPSHRLGVGRGGGASSCINVIARHRLVFMGRSLELVAPGPWGGGEEPEPPWRRGGAVGAASRRGQRTGQGLFAFCTAQPGPPRSTQSPNPPHPTLAAPLSPGGAPQTPPPQPFWSCAPQGRSPAGAHSRVYSFSDHSRFSHCLADAFTAWRPPPKGCLPSSSRPPPGPHAQGIAPGGSCQPRWVP